VNPLPLLAAREVEFAYPGKSEPVFHNLSFRMEPGEFLCILGPSGCGKSTLLNLAGGFLLPRKGNILFRNTPVFRPDRSRVMVFQGYDQLFPWKTVLGNVLFPMKPRDRSRARRLLELTRMEGREESLPRELSGGMRQRTALARALAADPELLLLDEPFDGLDPPTRRTLQETLLTLRNSLKISMLMVTHDIREAVFLADRILLMSPRGELLREYRPERKTGTGTAGDPDETLAEEIYREMESDRTR